MNKAILIGRAGKDPEVNRLQGGSTVAKLTLATSRRWTNKSGEKVEKTEWHHLVAWDKLAEIMEKWVHKGDQLFIEGEINYREYTDKEGINRYVTEILVSNMEMLGSKDKPEQKTEKTKVELKPVNIDDLPDPDAIDGDLPF